MLVKYAVILWNSEYYKNILWNYEVIFNTHKVSLFDFMYLVYFKKVYNYYTFYNYILFTLVILLLHFIYVENKLI